MAEKSEYDEFMPRERGLRAGYSWMELAHPEGDAVEQVVERGEIPQAVSDHVLAPATGMRERLDASVDPDAYARFWEGFIHGARAYMAKAQHRAGLGAN